MLCTTHRPVEQGRRAQKCRGVGRRHVRYGLVTFTFNRWIAQWSSIIQGAGEVVVLSWKSTAQRSGKVEDEVDVMCETRIIRQYYIPSISTPLTPTTPSSYRPRQPCLHP